MYILRIDSEAVAQKVEIYLLYFNSIYYKYNTRKSKVCRFDFPQFTMSQLEINLKETILGLIQDNICITKSIKFSFYVP